MRKILSGVACIFFAIMILQIRSPQAGSSIASQEPMGIPAGLDDNKAFPTEDDGNKTENVDKSKLEAKLDDFKKEMKKSPFKFGPSYDNKGAQIRLESQF